MKNNLLYITLNILVFLIVIVIMKPFYTSATVNQFTPLNSKKSPTADTWDYQSALDSKNIQMDSVEKIFTYEYNYDNIDLISRITDRIISQNSENQLNLLQQFSTILNDNNFTCKVNSSSENTLDTLFAAYTWANNFKTISVVSTGNKKVFNQVIYDYWMTEIVRNLETIVDLKPSLGYSIKFKVLRSLCEASNYSPTVKTSSIDKVLYNTENSRFNYIFGRFYLVFGNLGIFLAASMFIITLVSYLLLFIQIKTYFKNAKR
jgi:hypothetical protein